MLDPEYVRLLLEPLVQYLNIGVVEQAFPLHDLRTYPNATGHDDGDTEPMLVEASGDLLILAYMYPKATGALCGRGQLASTRLFSKNMRTTLVLKATDHTYLPG